MIYELETATELLPFWRFRGATPSPEHATRGILDHVLAQFVVEWRDTGEFLGFVNIHDPDLTSGHAAMAMVARPEARGSGVVVDGMLLLIDYAFKQWNLRRLYAHVHEHNLPQFRGALRSFLEQEAELREFYYGDDRHWSKFILVLTRQRWDLESGPWLRHIRGEAT